MFDLTRTSILLNKIKMDCPGELPVKADIVFGLFKCMIDDLSQPPSTVRSTLKGLMEVLKDEGIIENFTFESSPRYPVVKITPGNGKREIYFGFREK